MHISTYASYKYDVHFKKYMFGHKHKTHAYTLCDYVYGRVIIILYIILYLCEFIFY